MVVDARRSKRARPARGRGASARIVETPAAPKVPSRVLRRLAVAALAAVIVTLAVLNGRTLFDKLTDQRIEVVRIEGNLQYVSRAEVERAVRVFENRSMVSVD